MASSILLARYAISPRQKHVIDNCSALSGKDITIDNKESACCKSWSLIISTALPNKMAG